MVVGHQNKLRIGFIIQARMGSTRLPGKVLMPIPIITGKPVLSWIVQSLKRSKYFKENNICVATSTNKMDDIIYKYCIKSKINCYKGSESDVLGRFCKIIEEEQFDIIIRLTADNPLLDISILDELITFHLANKNHYNCTKGLPLGMNFEIVDAATLIKINKLKLSKSNREHVTLYIKMNSLFKKGSLNFEKKYVNLSKKRLTIDYYSDFIVVSSIINIGMKLKLDGISLIKYIQENQSWMFKINETNIQKLK